MYLAPNILPHGLLMVDPIVEAEAATTSTNSLTSSRWSTLRAALRGRRAAATTTAAPRLESARPAARWPLARPNACAE